MTTDKPKSDSRLGKHLQIIGAEPGGFADHELTSERAGIEAMNPPKLKLGDIQPLKVPVKTTSPKYTSWFGGIAIAMAAAIAVFVFVPKEDPGFRVKGAGQMRVFVETAGVVTEWDRQSKLSDGSRLRVEFKGLEDVTGVVGVVDRNFNDLFSAEAIWDKKVLLNAGDVKLSTGSIELTGEDEGEILIAVICPVAKFPQELTSFRKFWIDVKLSFLKKSDIKSGVAGCDAESVALR